tara:strand:+ start:1158 stop:2006 length:849 start_codon:yes stop_codon:yes gene_type:complete
MIFHYKDNLQELSYSLKTPLQYSDEFTFVPMKIKNKDILFQTPHLFTPYGIQLNDKSKKYVMISFQNKNNDTYTDTFLKDLEYIYKLAHNYYSQSYDIGRYNVNKFIKYYKNEPIMNVKFKEDSLIYDGLQNTIKDIPIYGYCSFIIHLAGLWISNNQIWFQWYILQTRIENNISLLSYAFKDSKPIPPPPPLPPLSAAAKSTVKDKYKKMITMGIPSAAVNQQKIIDAKAGINPNMLLSVQLKKTKPKKDIIKSDMNGFEPPSLDSLQKALRNLRNSLKGK